MTIELAQTEAVPKPWGSLDLRPWRDRQPDGVAIGEIWFRRAGTDPALLLKLLFTTAPLSIQVHPDDAFARSIGLPNGKTESWYIVSATPDAKVAVGLKRRLTAEQLRVAIKDGSIADLVAWHSVKAGDFIFVPAGTIHALGAGLVVAEVQQNSDATFRMFDYGRSRELQVDDAVAVARAEPFAWAASGNTAGLLTANPFFVVERLEIPEGTSRMLLVLAGSAQVGSISAKAGECIYMDETSASIVAGPGGLTAILANVAT
jgi:mannose-6-phosphate isomerase